MFILNPAMRIANLLFILCVAAEVVAGPSADTGNGHRMTPQEYIGKYKEDAIKDMFLTGVPASITLAQGILESESGNSDLARIANNHFGIKCHKDWTGETFHKDDDAKDECFRKYRSALESFDDHSRFLRERQRYAFLFDFETTDYKSWAHGLKKAGYATNPRYADLLIKLIEEHELHKYDKGGRRVPLTQPLATPQPPVSQPAPKKHIVVPGAGHTVNHNDVPYLIARPGDTYYSLAVANDLFLWQVLSYNDAGSEDRLEAGEIVYLKPKRGKPAEKSHRVKEGESMRSIAQMHGIKLKKLVKLNHLETGDAPVPGTDLRLR
jgi:LysM repeat protein